MINVATEIAKNNPSPKYKFGAVITAKNGRIVSVGENSYSRSHPMQARYGERYTTPEACFIHAEVAAIIRAKGKGHTLYVSRVLKNGTEAMARPCPACLGAIKFETKLRKVVYTVGPNEHGVIEVKR